MALTEYKNKRKFSQTPEPEGETGKKTVKRPAKNALQFVIQKHDASHLHYDLRLEMQGVMKSWAVPKGPSLNPVDRRLAMLVEDHPIEYNEFEGIIPAGNYGAGTVIIWDRGTYEPIEEGAKSKKTYGPDRGTKSPNKPLGHLAITDQEKFLLKGFYSGSLKIKLHGEKVQGEFALVKTGAPEEKTWLLIKHRDEHSSESDITMQDKSVVSGKTIEQMAADKKSKQWLSNRSSSGKLKTNDEASTSKSSGKRKKSTEAHEHESEPTPDYDMIVKEILGSLKKKKKTSMPADIKPMLATLIDDPFDDPEWIFEVKWDGYRTLAYVDNGNVELKSRNNNPFNEKFYPVYNALKEWPVRAIVDGEIVATNDKGLSEFGVLQNWTNEEDGELLMYLFDILWLDGVDCTGLPLIKRREILRKLAPQDGIVRFSENFDATGTEFFEVAKQIGLEGIIAKKADSTYHPDTRTRNWLKIKTEQRHEAIIAGYTRNDGSSKLFSAVILGVYRDGKLKFIGQAGTGFTDKMQTDLLKKLKPLETGECPFPEEPIINKPTRFRPKPPKAAVTWVKPVLVCEVKYQELTSEGIMRHPSFQGLVNTPVPVGEPENKKKRTAKKTNEPEAGSVDQTASATKKSATPSRKSNKQKGARPNDDDLLNATDETQSTVINGHELKFTNLSKVYWPKERISKRDMINYYYRMAPYMLPYMKDRPQSLNRHPDGVTGESFYQKNVAGKVDKWIKTHHYTNTTHPGEKTFFVCTDEASLLYIAKLGCIEMNPWHSRIQSVDNPDWCVIDLDPDDNPFEQVIETANVVRKILDAVGIPSYPKTSGSTGIHIYIPLGAKYTYEQSKQLAELVVTFAHDELGTFTSIVRNPAKRKGRIYLDFLQNRAIQTIAAPYSLRPKPGATASAPLHWDEVKKGLSIQDFTISNMYERVQSEGDLFKGVLGKGIDLQKVLEKIITVFG